MSRKQRNNKAASEPLPPGSGPVKILKRAPSPAAQPSPAQPPPLMSLPTNSIGGTVLPMYFPYPPPSSSPFPFLQPLPQAPPMWAHRNIRDQLEKEAARKDAEKHMPQMEEATPEFPDVPLTFDGKPIKFRIDFRQYEATIIQIKKPPCLYMKVSRQNSEVTMAQLFDFQLELSEENHKTFMAGMKELTNLIEDFQPKNREWDGRFPVCTVSKPFLEKYHVMEIEKKNEAFPEAIYYCTICDYHISSIMHLRNHMENSQHMDDQKRLEERENLRNVVPSPSKSHEEALTNLFNGLIEKDPELNRQAKVLEEITIPSIIKTQLSLPEDRPITVKLYGSVLLGCDAGQANSDINILIDVAGVEMGDSADAMTKIYEGVVNTSKITDVELMIADSMPRILFRMEGIRVRLAWRNRANASTSELLALYTGIRAEVPILMRLVRRWAKLCQIDNSDRTRPGLHRYGFDIMVVHFMQKRGYLPVLHEMFHDRELNRPTGDGNRLKRGILQIDVDFVKKHLKDSDQFQRTIPSVASMFIDFLSHYMTDHNEIIQFVESAPVGKEVPKWSRKLLQISDPFRNDNVVQFSKPFQCFFFNCFIMSYIYFALPRSRDGPAVVVDLFQKMDVSPIKKKRKALPVSLPASVQKDSVLTPKLSSAVRKLDSTKPPVHQQMIVEALSPEEEIEEDAKKHRRLLDAAAAKTSSAPKISPKQKKRNKKLEGKTELDLRVVVLQKTLPSGITVEHPEKRDRDVKYVVKRLLNKLDYQERIMQTSISADVDDVTTAGQLNSKSNGSIFTGNVKSNIVLNENNDSVGRECEGPLPNSDESHSAKVLESAYRMSLSIDGIPLDDISPADFEIDDVFCYSRRTIMRIRRVYDDHIHLDTTIREKLNGLNISLYPVAGTILDSETENDDEYNDQSTPSRSTERMFNERLRRRVIPSFSSSSVSSTSISLASMSLDDMESRNGSTTALDGHCPYQMLTNVSNGSPPVSPPDSNGVLVMSSSCLVSEEMELREHPLTSSQTASSRTHSYNDVITTTTCTDTASSSMSHMRSDVAVHSIILPAQTVDVLPDDVEDAMISSPLTPVSDEAFQLPSAPNTPEAEPSTPQEKICFQELFVDFKTPPSDISQLLQRTSSWSVEDYQFSFDDPSNFNGGYRAEFKCSYCDQSDHTPEECPQLCIPPIDPIEHVMLDAEIYEINKIIEKHFDSSCLLPSRIKKISKLVRTIEAFLQANMDPESKLDIFGSLFNGFGTNKSDVDICFRLTSSLDAPPGNADAQDAIRMISKTLEKLKLKEPDTVCNIQYILSAKVPIVKFHSPFAQIEGDISYYNQLAMHNTQMLASYCKWAPDVLPQLGLWIKQWAKSCDIGDASKGSLSSYSYTIMTIHFLQNVEPPVLPRLQEDFLPLMEKPDVEGHNVNFYQGEAHKDWSKNKLSVGELFCAFIDYYSRFDFKTQVVQIRRKKVLLRLEKNWNRSMNIEDPFDLNHNLSSGVSLRMYVYIMKSFIKTRSTYLSGVMWNKISDGKLDQFAELNDEQLKTFKNLLVEGCLVGSPPADRQCRKCHHIGHFADNCPGRDQRCHYCQKTGHFASKCPNKRSGTPRGGGYVQRPYSQSQSRFFNSGGGGGANGTRTFNNSRGPPQGYRGRGRGGGGTRPAAPATNLAEHI